MTDYSGSTTPAAERDLWCTPAEIFTALHLEFAFQLDAAADSVNAKCASFLTEQDNALICDWISDGAVWVNPPYSDISPWVEKAEEQCRRQGQPVVMLVPADVSTGWFSRAMDSVDEIRLVTGGRIQFRPVSREGKRNSNPKGSMFLIWRPFIRPRGMFTTINKSELVQIGAEFLEEECAA